MSKSTEEFKKLMESDRGEAARYELCPFDEQIWLPVTRSGFEALVARACKELDLPVTGPNRNVAVSFLHSLGRTTPKTSVEAVMNAIWNSLSSHTTYTIDQEIKLEANKELRDEQEALKKAHADLARQRGLSRQQQKLAEREAKKNARETKQAAKNGQNAGNSPALTANETQT